jgi:predicted amidohydrolase
MKAAIVQIAPKLGDPDANLARHLEGVRRARARGADLVVFPELSLTGYLLQDLVPEMAEEARGGRRLKALAAASRGIGLVSGFVERGAGLSFFNAAACFSSGALIHVHRKVYLPTYGMFDEGRYFSPGDTFRTFDAPWGRTGMLICEDFWHLSAPYLLSLQGLEVLIVISASPVKGVDASPRLKSAAPWVDLARAVARQMSCWVIYANRSGYEDGWSFQGGSFVCAPSGELIAEGKVLKDDLVVAALPAAALRKARLAYTLLRDEKIDLVRREMDRIAFERPASTIARRAASGEPG